VRLSPNVMKPVAVVAGVATFAFLGFNALKGDDGFGFGPDEYTEIEHAESTMNKIQFPASLTVVRGEGTGEAATHTRVQIQTGIPGLEQAAWLANKTALTFTDKRAGAKRAGSIALEIKGSAIDAEPYTVKNGKHAGETGIRVNVDTVGIDAHHEDMHTLEAYGSNDILPRYWTFLTNDDGTTIRTSTAIDLADSSFESGCAKSLLPTLYAGTQNTIKDVYEIVAGHISKASPEGKELAEDLQALAARPIDVNFYRKVSRGDKFTKREPVDLIHNTSGFALPEPVGTPKLKVSSETNIDTGSEDCKMSGDAITTQAGAIIQANKGVVPPRY
jgi:hypothetical protein